jgi:hypothetical protein
MICDDDDEEKLSASVVLRPEREPFDVAIVYDSGWGVRISLVVVYMQLRRVTGAS